MMPLGRGLNRGLSSVEWGEIWSVRLFVCPPQGLSAGPEGLPAGFGALPDGSEALPTGSEVLPAGFEAHPA